MQVRVRFERASERASERAPAESEKPLPWCHCRGLPPLTDPAILAVDQEGLRAGGQAQAQKCERGCETAAGRDGTAAAAEPPLLLTDALLVVCSAPREPPQARQQPLVEPTSSSVRGGRARADRDSHDPGIGPAAACARQQAPRSPPAPPPHRLRRDVSRGAGHGCRDCGAGRQAIRTAGAIRSCQASEQVEGACAARRALGFLARSAAIGLAAPIVEIAHPLDQRRSLQAHPHSTRTQHGSPVSGLQGLRPLQQRPPGPAAAAAAPPAGGGARTGGGRGGWRRQQCERPCTCLPPPPFLS